MSIACTSIACESSSNTFMDTTPLKSLFQADKSHNFLELRQSNLTAEANLSQISYDPMRAFGVLKSEFIFVFSGFNDHKIKECEMFNTATQTWQPISNLHNPRTKFSAIAISKSRILILGGKQSDGQRTNEIEEFNVKDDVFRTLPFKM